MSDELGDQAQRQPAFAQGYGGQAGTEAQSNRSNSINSSDAQNAEYLLVTCRN